MKNKIFNWLLSGVVLTVLILIYGRWFIHREIIGGDWPYIFNNVISSLPIFPPSWSSTHGNGLGGTILTYSLDSYLFLGAWIFTNLFHLPWQVIYKICWFGLFFVFSVGSSIYAYKVFFPRSKLLYALICSLIYTSNTFILMVTGGGQMGVALSYATFPLVVSFFVQVIKQKKIISKSLFLLSIIFGINILLDVRIAYLAVIACFLYWILCLLSEKKLIFFYRSLIKIAVAFVGAIGLNMFWLLPVAIVHENSLNALGDAYVSAAAVRFFSFAKFEYSFSLLHPNWPENIFGKVNFLRPEFLILPLIAFASIFFIKRVSKELKNQNVSVAFLILLALLGIFLGKGAQEPFGDFYIFLFEKFPGFEFFRDSIKFYTLIALSYSLLIPFVLHTYQEKIAYKLKRLEVLSFLIPFGFIIFWCYLISPVFKNQLTGTFVSHEVPNEYIGLNNFLSSQPDFFRVLWIPRQSRFTSGTNIHPSMEAQPLFNAKNTDQIIKALQKNNSIDLLSKLSVKYIAIPYDSLGEIFVKDRKYDNATYEQAISDVKNIQYLTPVEAFGKIAVFQTPGFHNLFWDENNDQVSYKSSDGSSYLVKVSLSKSTNLFFSQNYSNNWVAWDGEKYIYPRKTKEGLQVYPLQRSGSYTLSVYFTGTKWFIIGKLLSGIAFIVLITAFFYATIRKSKKI